MRFNRIVENGFLLQTIVLLYVCCFDSRELWLCDLGSLPYLPMNIILLYQRYIRLGWVLQQQENWIYNICSWNEKWKWNSNNVGFNVSKMFAHTIYKYLQKKCNDWEDVGQKHFFRWLFNSTIHTWKFAHLIS